MSAMMFARLTPICLILLLPGCGGNTPETEGDALARLESELTAAQSANATDPAIMAALADPIMIDPQLSGPGHADAVRPPAAPYAAPLPHPGIATGTKADDPPIPAAPTPTPLTDRSVREALTLAALASAMPGAGAAECSARLTYSAAWATRMPPEMPLHPDARVIEAGGAEGEGCSMRVVSFYVAHPTDAMVNWYYDRAREAGYAAEHQLDGPTHLVGGSNPRGNVRYRVMLTDRGDGGTDVELITRR